MDCEYMRKAAVVAEDCVDCGICMRLCPFLKKYNGPKQIALKLLQGSDQNLSFAFECSLCGLCESVCTRNISLSNLFLDVRREAVQQKTVSMKPYKNLLNYEKKGNSKLFSLFAIPEGCKTVFFPGCTLSGTRSGTTEKIYRVIAEKIPDLGVVMACCSKPSHDLGLKDEFERGFYKILNRLTDLGVEEVLVACPNCYKVFKNYGQELKTSSVYEFFAAGQNFQGLSQTRMEAVVHDPCPLRFEPEIQQAVRSLLNSMKVDVFEMKNRGKRTLCCGEGGTVQAAAPQFARQWSELRAGQAAGKRCVTYCAGCAGYLSRHMQTDHILDLIFFEEEVKAGKFRATRSPFTYARRLLLKQRLRAAVFNQ